MYIKNMPKRKYNIKVLEYIIEKEDIKILEEIYKKNTLNNTFIPIDNNKLSFVQCKNGYKKGLNIEDLAGFSIMTLTYQNFINKGYVYYTNKLSKNILSLPQCNMIEFIKHPFNESVNESINESVIEPYDYQLEAIKKVKANNVFFILLKLSIYTYFQ